MSDLGVEIHRSYDELGPIRVFENGSRRYLAFGEEAEQSCIDLHDPAKLVYEYTQAMILALLFFLFSFRYPLNHKYMYLIQF